MIIKNESNKWNGFTASARTLVVQIQLIWSCFRERDFWCWLPLSGEHKLYIRRRQQDWINGTSRD